MPATPARTQPQPLTFARAAANAHLLHLRPPPRALGLAAALLALHPPPLRRPRRARLRARSRHLQRPRQPAREPLQRQLAVAVLGARVLRDRGHAPAEPRADPVLLGLRERLGGVDVEDRLHPRRRHVGVLPARPRGARDAQLDLLERQFDAFNDGQIGHDRLLPAQLRAAPEVRVGAAPAHGRWSCISVEASALRAPAGLSRLSISAPLLRLRSDDQLLALFRAGSDEAFNTLHERYKQRLFAYVRQMLASQSRQDAEDVLQDVFVRAFGALRADDRQVNVRAWLYRVAHNRCIDHLRRPTPPPAEIFEMSRKPLHDPIEEAQRREDLARLISDVGRLPEQQRSALLMRELDGLSYADLAAALDVTVPAIKSLLVRARVGLVEAQEARDADCTEIRRDLHASYDRGVKASGRARRHLRECSGCREYRVALRSVRRSFAALVPPAAFGPLALAAKLLGAGGAGGGAAAAGTAGAGAGAGAGGGIVVVGGAAACKVAVVVCATAITAGGAVEMQRLAHHERANEQTRTAHKPKVPGRASVAAMVAATAPSAPVPVAAVPDIRTRRPARV